MENDNKSILAAQCVGSVIKYMEDPLTLLFFITGSFTACDYAPEDDQRGIRDLLLLFQEYILVEWLQNDNREMTANMEYVLDRENILEDFIKPAQALTVAIQIYQHAGINTGEHKAFVKGTSMLFDITNTIIEAETNS